MAGISLFDRLYAQAYTRGHAVHCAAEGMRQLRIGTKGSAPAAYGLFALAEQLVDAADDFYRAMSPRFRVGLTGPGGETLIYANTACVDCGHPYCRLYLMAGSLPKRDVLPVALIQTIGFLVE
jgi:hypothetical protein